jgi:uncharacterized HAD superfamily protein
MKFCIDLDNTLIKLNDFFIRKVSSELGYNYTAYDNTDLKLTAFPDNFIKRSHELFVDGNFMGGIPIYKDTQEKLIHWKLNGHYLTIITAREKTIEKETLKLIDREYPIVDDILIVGWNNNKEELLRNGNFDVIIDDNQHCIQSAINVGIPNIYMISNNETRYNIPYIDKFINNGVHIVSSILEVNA